jgi:L-ascorbate metabolism protein UlaG (beta-lactamase superfamily)
MNRWYKCGKALLGEIAGSKPQPGEAYIWFVGQHGFVINLGGMVFYIDVILNDLPDKDGNTRRVYPPPFDPGETQRVDYVLCTHNHSDHLNLKTLLPLAEANPRSRFVVPAPCKRVLIEAGIGDDRILAARAGESLSPLPSGSVSIDPVPAIHTRYIQDEGAKDENGDYTSLGFVLKGDGISIYHSGDTWVTPSLVQILKTHAPLNIAMLPINGADWERTEGNCIGNMGALDAVKLARALSVDLVFPAHYDMMAFNSENPARFADSMYALCPEKRFHVCALGERFVYKRDSEGITR